MEFEWDRAKNRGNFLKHGVLFAYAVEIFLDPFRTDWLDDRPEYGEERRVTIGRIEGKLFVVAYTLRGRAVRLISARKANDREERKYNSSPA